MALRIEDYAIIGDTNTAALVGKDGSIDWLCLPRLDSAACFANLLGTPENGRWLICPEGEVRQVRRRYREGTLILETDFVTDEGEVTLVDLMPFGTEDSRHDLARLVVGKRGAVSMRTELVIRFDYGRIVPWVRRRGDGIRAIAGPDAIDLHTAVPLEGKDFHTVGRFTVQAGQTVPFELTWFPSHLEPPGAHAIDRLVAETEAWWRAWTEQCTYRGDWHEAVVRSLITLKALTYSPTGGIAAAATTSLPEALGGVRNWDYRYCWLRDSTFTLLALLTTGFEQEAEAWREWLLRAVAGQPEQLQILYGLAGERHIQELEVPWLPGYEGSRPVRIGNQAHSQVQLDVYGEIMDTFHIGRHRKIQLEEDSWRVQKVLLDYLEKNWREPDHGIWEVRGERRHFTHSKIMAWVAVNRSIRSAKRHRIDAPLDRWSALADAIHDEVCGKGFDADRNTFVWYYGATVPDASLLQIPVVGFLPADDARVRGTLKAVERNLLKDGLVRRYITEPKVDGLPPGEATFLACSFWYADNLAMVGRRAEAREVFEHLLSLRNDVGLLAEEYDTTTRRQLGNFPQAFSHVGLINTAQTLAAGREPPRRQAAGS